MDGETYFEVQHDAQAPFVVSTNGLDIQGARHPFNIPNDDNDHRITTVPARRRRQGLRFGRRRPPYACRPSQQLVFDTDRRHAP